MILLALLAQAAVTAAPPPARATADPFNCGSPRPGYAPARSFTGVWIDDFEGQRFFEGREDASALPWLEPLIWIEVDIDEAYRRGFRKTGNGQAYRVTIVGEPSLSMNRKPLCGYGHFGMSAGEIRRAKVVKWSYLGEPVRPSNSPRP